MSYENIKKTHLFKYTTVKYYKKLVCLKEFQVLPHELCELCMIYFGKREFVANLSIDFSLTQDNSPVYGNIRFVHTPLRLKNVRMINSEFRFENLFGTHDHTIHIDANSNQETVKLIKRLQKFIENKYPRLHFTRIQIKSKNRIMKPMSYVFRNKTIQSHFPVKTPDFYELTCIGCSSLACKKSSVNSKSETEFEFNDPDSCDFYVKKHRDYEQYKTQNETPPLCDVDITLAVIKRPPFVQSLDGQMVMPNIDYTIFPSIVSIKYHD